MNRILSLMILLGLVLPVLAQDAASSQAPSQAFDEYQVKAAFLYNFAKFVEWPPGTFPNTADPIGICIVGHNPFGTALDDMVQGKKLGARGFVVHRLPDMHRAGECQILFVAAVEWMHTRAWLESLKSAAILTVGETDGFATVGGGIINFRLEGTRVHLQMDLEAAERCHLRISSKLLSLAEIVKHQP